MRSKKTIHQLNPGDLFLYIEDPSQSINIFKNTIKVDNTKPIKIWGLVKEISFGFKTQKKRSKSSYIYYKELHYFNYQRNRESYLIIYLEYDITFYKIGPDDLSCKDWFKSNPIESYLTSEFDYVRNWVKGIHGIN